MYFPERSDLISGTIRDRKDNLLMFISHWTHITSRKDIRIDATVEAKSPILNVGIVSVAVYAEYFQNDSEGSLNKCG